MSASKAEALEPFRRYPEVLARVHLDPRLRGKLDPADIVQQTLLRACAALPELRGRSPQSLAAWLRRILAHTLADTVKHYHRDRRDVDLEHALEADLDRSSSGLAGWPRTRPRPARPPRATRSCSASPTPWPTCRSRCARSSF